MVPGEGARGLRARDPGWGLRVRRRGAWGGGAALGLSWRLRTRARVPAVGRLLGPCFRAVIMT